MTDRTDKAESELTEDLEPNEEEAEQVKGGRRVSRKDRHEEKLSCKVKIPGLT